MRARMAGTTTTQVTIRGGGEMGSAIAHAFALAGLRLLVLDRPLPGALRLGVAFAAAAVSADGRVTIEGITAARCRDRREIEAAWARGEIALWIDPWTDPTVATLRPGVLVDARMRSLTEPMTRLDEAPLVIGVGPGFDAGRDCHYVIESNRGPRLGAVITSGPADSHTGVPGDVLGFRDERILRAPRTGRLERARDLGDFVEPGDVVATVDGAPVVARLGGMIRGLKLSGAEVGAGHKVGDVDPRRDRALLSCMTDKARAVARGALEAAVLAGVLGADALGPARRARSERSIPPCT